MRHVSESERQSTYMHIGGYAGVERLGKELENKFRFHLYSLPRHYASRAGLQASEGNGCNSPLPSLVGNKAEMDGPSPLWPLETTQPKVLLFASLRVRPSSKVLGIQSRPGPRHFSTDSPAGEVLFCHMLQTYWMVLCVNLHV